MICQICGSVSQRPNSKATDKGRICQWIKCTVNVHLSVYHYVISKMYFHSRLWWFKIVFFYHKYDGQKYNNIRYKLRVKRNEGRWKTWLKTFPDLFLRPISTLSDFHIKLGFIYILFFHTQCYAAHIIKMVDIYRIFPSFLYLPFLREMVARST